MAALHFIGLGLGPDGMTHEATEAARACATLFMETYTARPVGLTIEALGARLGRPVRELDRAALEDGSEVLAAAARGPVGILVVGDPFASTTHIALRLRALEAGIPAIHHPGVSILTAAPAAAGLNPTKFGRTVSIPRPQPGFAPESPYDQLLANRTAGLHTLVLLDVDGPAGPALTASEAVGVLREIEGTRRAGAFGDRTIVCVVARLGSSAPFVRAGRASDVAAWPVGPAPHSLLVPGELHFQEAEALVRLAGLDAQLLPSKATAR